MDGRVYRPGVAEHNERMARRWLGFSILLSALLMGPASASDAVINSLLDNRSQLEIKRKLIGGGRVEVTVKLRGSEQPLVIQVLEPDGRVASHQEFASGSATPSYSLAVNFKNQTSIEKMPDREVVSRIHQGKLRKQVFIQKNGSRVLRSEELLELTEESEGDGANCEPNTQFRDLRTLAGSISLRGRQGSFFTTPLQGVQIHESCVRKFGSQFASHIVNSFQRGLQCLIDHDGPAARSNLARIVALVSNRERPLKVTCATSLRPGVMGMATVSPLDPNHPRVSLAPTGLPAEAIESTFFHELLHVCGHRHDVDVEHSWTCEDCCFGRTRFNPASDRSSPACRICGEHQNVNDVRYLEDLVDYSNSGAVRTLINQMGRDPSRSQDYVRLFAESIPFSEGSEPLVEAFHQTGLPRSLVRSQRRYTPKAPAVVGPTERNLAEAVSLLARNDRARAVERLEAAVSAWSTTSGPARSFNQRMLRYTASEIWNRGVVYDNEVKALGRGSSPDSQREEQIRLRAFDLMERLK